MAGKAPLPATMSKIPQKLAGFSGEWGKLLGQVLALAVPINQGAGDLKDGAPISLCWLGRPPGLPGEGCSNLHVVFISLASGHVDNCLQPSHKTSDPSVSFYEMPSYAPTTRLLAPNIVAFLPRAVGSRGIDIHNRIPRSTSREKCVRGNGNLVIYSVTIGRTLLYSSFCPAGV